MTRREHAAIMAGLRMLQSCKGTINLQIDHILTESGEFTALTDTEIDALCIRLNTATDYLVEN